MEDRRKQMQGHLAHAREAKVRSCAARGGLHWVDTTPGSTVGYRGNIYLFIMYIYICILYI